MREIKFRQRTPNGWHYWGVIDRQFRSPAIVDGVDAGQSYQYTGLKDKDGVEIYEGDLLFASKFADSAKPVAVIYDANAGAFKANGSISVSQIAKYGLEAIGNIMENPELLK